MELGDSYLSTEAVHVQSLNSRVSIEKSVKSLKASRKIKRGNIYFPAISDRKGEVRGTSGTGNIREVYHLFLMLQYLRKLNDTD